MPRGGAVSEPPTAEGVVPDAVAGEAAMSCGPGLSVSGNSVTSPVAGTSRPTPCGTKRGEPDVPVGGDGEPPRDEGVGMPTTSVVEGRKWQLRPSTMQD